MLFPVVGLGLLGKRRAKRGGGKTHAAGFGGVSHHSSDSSRGTFPVLGSARVKTRDEEKKRGAGSGALVITRPSDSLRGNFPTVEGEKRGGTTNVDRIPWNAQKMFSSWILGLGTEKSKH